MLFDYWVKHVQIIRCVCNEALHEMVRLQQEKQNELVKKSEVETKPSSISSQLKMCRDGNTYIMLCCVFLPLLTAAAVRLLADFSLFQLHETSSFV